MNTKGQTSIEFLIIVLIIVVYLFTVTKPIIESSQGTIEDIKNLNQTKEETQKLIDSINKINNYSTNSKETIILITPKYSTIYCNNDGNIGFKTEINKKYINPQIRNCENNICDKNYSLNTALDCQIKEIIGLQKIIIEKKENNVEIRKG